MIILYLRLSGSFMHTINISALDFGIPTEHALGWVAKNAYLLLHIYIYVEYTILVPIQGPRPIARTFMKVAGLPVVNTAS